MTLGLQADVVDHRRARRPHCHLPAALAIHAVRPVATVADLAGGIRDMNAARSAKSAKTSWTHRLPATKLLAAVNLLSQASGLRVAPMTNLELIIQLLKIALGVAIGIYFLWWSLEVLQRLPVHQ